MKTLYTHSGDFHSDELMAIALLKRFVFPEEAFEVIRTRQPKVLEQALANPHAFVLDVGKTHDPDCLNFDHHQEGGADSWEDGTPKSSCGLVWSWLRQSSQLGDMTSDEMDRVEQELVKPVDAHDNGVARWPLAPLFRIYNRSGAKEDVIQSQFMEALRVAQDLVENQINQVQLDLAAEAYLQECWDYAREAGDTIVVAHRQLGNRTAPTLLARLSGFEADLMVYPQSGSRKNNKWFIRALPTSEGSAGYRWTFPPSMRGKHEAELDLGDGTTAQFTFVHNSGFLAQIQGQFADAYRVAQAVLNHPENSPSPVLSRPKMG